MRMLKKTECLKAHTYAIEQKMDTSSKGLKTKRSPIKAYTVPSKKIKKPIRVTTRKPAYRENMTYAMNGLPKLRSIHDDMVD